MQVLLQKGYMRRKNVALVVFLAFFCSVAVAIAYFSYRANTPLGTFSTGYAEIDVSATDGQITNMLPGGSTEVEVVVTNTGTVPVHLRTLFSGTWDDPGLDPSTFSVTALQRDTGSGWQQVAAPVMLDAFVYHSPLGLEDGLEVLEPNEVIRYLATLQLSPAAGNEYMNSIFSSQVTVEAKQAQAESSWPL